jgi:uncharacterized protein (DUF362 family)
MSIEIPISGKRNSRRDFIRKSSLGIMGISLVKRAYPLIRNAISRVIVVRHRDVIGIDGHAAGKLVVDMVDRGITALASTRSVTDAWKRFFTPDDVIAMKINAINFEGLANTPLASHYPALCHAIVASCEKAGIGSEQFIIWDRQEGELSDVGLTPSNESGKLRVMGTNGRSMDGKIGYRSGYFIGVVPTFLSRIMTDICTAAINVPVIKPHGMAGITIALKNHYGSINNPWLFHLNSCTEPGIPELNALKLIRNKERLIICNALQAVYGGSNKFHPKYTWPYGGIILGTDPVAVDTVCLKIMNEKRTAEGRPAKTDQSVRHLRLSEELHVGTANPDKIELIEIELA